MAIAGINIPASQHGGVLAHLNHVLAHHLQVVHARSAGGVASPAMAPAAGRFGLTKKSVWNILISGLVGLEEEGTQLLPSLQSSAFAVSEGD